MDLVIRQIMEKYGASLEVLRQGTWVPFRGFLQPSRSNSRQNLERETTLTGEIPQGRYVFIGPPEVEITEGDLLRCRGREYLFRRAEEICCRDAVVYRWGLCVGKGAEDKWGSSSK